MRKCKFRANTRGWAIVKVAVSISAAVWSGLLSVGADIPFSAIRLRKGQTDNADTWRRTLEQFRKYRDGVDDVWFSTGICFPPMAEHEANSKRLAAAADDLRKIGILPSLQIQATIGHGDSFASFADNSGQTWQKYVAEDGTVSRTMNCPRAPEFLEYMAKMASLYAAAMKPYSVWIDDDIRIIYHHANGDWSGWGCHCKRCLEAFSERYGASMTREELVTAMKSNKALAEHWRSFAFDSELGIVRAIAKAVHKASPGTRMCQQQPGACFAEHRALYVVHSEATGLPVGMRPGAGAYYDHDPCAQIAKSYTLALQIDTIGMRESIDRICPEIETSPRTFACRTGRGILLEALECLAQGMNSLSMLAMDATYETPEWYGETILAPLARNAAMLKRLAAANDGASRAGYATIEEPTKPLQVSSLPLKPLLAVPRGDTLLLDADAAKRAIAAGAWAVDKLLSNNLVMDGEAAQALLNAGRGADIGLHSIQAFDGALRERFVRTGGSAPVYGKTYFLVPAQRAETEGEYFSDASARPGEAVGVSATRFVATNGLRRAIYGHGVFGRALAVASSARLADLHGTADWAAHGTAPVVLDTPARAFVQPCVRKDGSLASVTVVNASIGNSAPIKMRLRGISPDVASVVWSQLDSPDEELMISREGGDAVVTIPSMQGWTGGYLLFPRRK